MKAPAMKKPACHAMKKPACCEIKAGEMKKPACCEMKAEKKAPKEAMKCGSGKCGGK
ncbi:MAG: hypothetical protein Q9M43_04735 [Sulfurimonas sp.]|nr:hypothetical protein [Sulfurimonas sp.]